MDRTATIEIDSRVGPFSKREVWFANEVSDCECDLIEYLSVPARLDVPGFKTMEYPTIVLDPSKELGCLWKGLDRTSQKKVRRATSNGIRVQMNRSYEEFVDLCFRFQRKKGHNFIIIPADYMRRCGVLFTAHRDGKMLAGRFYIADSGNMFCAKSATGRLEHEGPMVKLIGQANALLFWEAIRHANRQGIKSFDFGGGVLLPGLHGFKRGFGGETTLKYNYVKYNSALYRVAEAASRSLAFLPLWRWIPRLGLPRVGDARGR